MKLQAHPHGPLQGEARVPGDKSISHRALMFAALAVGESRIAGLLEGEDVMATAQALRGLGVAVAKDAAGGAWSVSGAGLGGFAEPDAVLDLGNAGTGARLLMGILAGLPFPSFLTGDASLRSRPMRRVIEPLEAMGASFVARSNGRLPLVVIGRGETLATRHRSEVASAQVKSAVLLAGLAARGETSVVEPQASRDHTERMLQAMGADLRVQDTREGHAVAITGMPELRPFDLAVPGDPSSAAFVVAAAACTPGSAVTVRGVGVNPLRTGLFATLREMGAVIVPENERCEAGEPVADLRVEGARLRGVDVPPERAPSMIDEYPVLAALSCVAEGTTRMRGLKELRVKESDRLSVMAEGLAACGADVAVEGDDLIVRGRGTNRGLGGATVDARLDHRIAMSFLVLGGLAEAPVAVAGAQAIATSFPGFERTMNDLGTKVVRADREQPGEEQG